MCVSDHCSATSASHDSVVAYLLSMGASLDARRLATSPEELAFLRAANKLYIGARKQDLTALDEEDLLSLQSHLLQKMKHLTLVEPAAYAEEPLVSSKEGSTTGLPSALQQTPSPLASSPDMQTVVMEWKALEGWPAALLQWTLQSTYGDWLPRLKAAERAALRIIGAKVWSGGVFAKSEVRIHRHLSVAVLSVLCVTFGLCLYLSVPP